MTDEQLVRCFESAEVPPGGFGHAAHVRVAWWYLRQAPLGAALEQFRSGLRRFAAAHGVPQKYHETMTTAYVLLIHERLEHGGRDLGWDEFAARHEDLLAWRPSILDRYYRAETLESDRARTSFVAPDQSEDPVLSGPFALQTARRDPAESPVPEIPLPPGIVPDRQHN